MSKVLILAALLTCSTLSCQQQSQQKGVVALLNANKGKLTPEALIKEEWRLYATYSPMILLDGFPVAFSDSGKVEAGIHFSNLTQWQIGDDGGLLLLDENGKTHFHLMLDECQDALATEVDRGLIIGVLALRLQEQPNLKDACKNEGLCALDGGRSPFCCQACSH